MHLEDGACCYCKVSLAGLFIREGWTLIDSFSVLCISFSFYVLLLAFLAEVVVGKGLIFDREPITCLYFIYFLLCQLLSLGSQLIWVGSRPPGSNGILKHMTIWVVSSSHWKEIYWIFFLFPAWHNSTGCETYYVICIKHFQLFEM